MSDCVPELRFSEFGGEWEEKKLESIGKIVTGATPPTKDKENFENGDYLWVTPGDICYSKYVEKTERNLTTTGIENARLIHGKSVLVTCIGATIGKVCIINEDGSCNQQINAITPNKMHNNEFIYYIIDKNPEKLRNYAGLTATPILNKKSFGNIRFMFPSLPEQKKIGSFLSKIDEKIEKLEKKKELWENYKKGMIQQIFSQELRFKDENREDYPDWEEKTLGDIAKFSKGKGISKNDISSNGIECIRYGELYTTYKEEIKDVKCKTNLKIEELVLSDANDIIIPTSGETAIDLATASCVMKSGVAIGGDTTIIKTNENGLFLSYYLNSQKNKIGRLAQGVSVVHLYPSQLKELELKIPNIMEQNKMADFLSAIEIKIDKIYQELEICKEFKKGLLQQMFC